MTAHHGDQPANADTPDVDDIRHRALPCQPHREPPGMPIEQTRPGPPHHDALPPALARRHEARPPWIHHRSRSDALHAFTVAHALLSLGLIESVLSLVDSGSGRAGATPTPDVKTMPGVLRGILCPRVQKAAGIGQA
jgi:hypothetical protein